MLKTIDEHSSSVINTEGTAKSTLTNKHFGNKFQNFSDDKYTSPYSKSIKPSPKTSSELLLTEPFGLSPN